MAVTGVIYSLLLRCAEVDTEVPWVNLVLHYVLPIIMIVDWLIDLPPSRIRIGSAMVWLVYPILYLGYSLIRGSILGRYPYLFLDPRPDGYAPVIIVSLGLAVSVLLLAVLMSWTTRLHVSVTKQ